MTKGDAECFSTPTVKKPSSSVSAFLTSEDQMTGRQRSLSSATTEEEQILRRQDSNDSAMHCLLGDSEEDLTT